MSDTTKAFLALGVGLLLLLVARDLLRSAEGPMPSYPMPTCPWEPPDGPGPEPCPSCPRR